MKAIKRKYGNFCQRSVQVYMYLCIMPTFVLRPTDRMPMEFSLLRGGQTRPSINIKHPQTKSRHNITLCDSIQNEAFSNSKLISFYSLNNH